MSRNVIAGIALFAVAACSSPPVHTPQNVTFRAATSQRTYPTPIRAPGAAPEIVHIDYAPEVTRGAGGHFTGTIWTSSNVASVEMRTNLFSINARKSDVGRFDFDVAVYDLPPIFVRAYTLRAIARNTAGTEAEEDLPLRIR
jgi:hypothetical protein